MTDKAWGASRQEESGSDQSLPQSGTDVVIVKLRPDGSEATRYSGIVVPGQSGWIVARATWGRSRLDLGYLVFEPDDVFVEYFALENPFNAFALCSNDGTLKGWYCNVTHLTHVHLDQVVWHDLFVDVIVYPDGRQLVLDEDELAEAGIEQSDPDLHRMILDSAEELQRRARAKQYPFSDDPLALLFREHD